MWNRVSDRLRCLGHDCKNLWLEGLWQHPLNSINGWPMAFEGGRFVAVEIDAEQVGWTKYQRSIVPCW